MSSLSVRIRYEALRSLAFGGISGAYAGVGTAFADPVRILKITNLTDADLLISFDGVTDRDIIPANTVEVLDYGSNRAETGGQLDQSLAIVSTLSKQAVLNRRISLCNCYIRFSKLGEP